MLAHSLRARTSDLLVTKLAQIWKNSCQILKRCDGLGIKANLCKKSKAPSKSAPRSSLLAPPSYHRTGPELGRRAKYRGDLYDTYFIGHRIAHVVWRPTAGLLLTLSFCRMRVEAVWTPAREQLGDDPESSSWS